MHYLFNGQLKPKCFTTWSCQLLRLFETVSHFDLISCQYTPTSHMTAVR